MDKTIIIVLAVVGSLGLLSAILGFSAERTKLTISDVLVGDEECFYPHNPAFALGVCAAVFLAISQLMFGAIGGCCCCMSRPIPSKIRRIIGVVCALFSWIAAAIAFSLFVKGASSNTEGRRKADNFGRCYFLKDGFFTGAAVLTLAATALAIISDVLLGRLPKPNAPAAAPQTEGGKLPVPLLLITLGTLLSTCA
ncbi:unnamed protein product [Alopecurus aequalis]